MDELVHVGFVLKPHGYQGHIRVSLLLEEARNIETEWVMLIINNKPVPFFVTELSRTNNDWLLQLEDIRSDQDAKEIQGLQVYVPSHLLPDIQSESQASLIGFKIIDDQYGELTEIEDEFESAKQYFITITHQAQEILIPLVPDIVYEVDLKQKIAYTKIPDGLLDINL